MLVALGRVGVDFLEILLVEILAARVKALKGASGKASPASPVGPDAQFYWMEIDKIWQDKGSWSVGSSVT